MYVKREKGGVWWHDCLFFIFAIGDIPVLIKPSILLNLLEPSTFPYFLPSLLPLKSSRLPLWLAFTRIVQGSLGVSESSPSRGTHKTPPPVSSSAPHPSMWSGLCTPSLGSEEGEETCRSFDEKGGVEERSLTYKSETSLPRSIWDLNPWVPFRLPRHSHSDGCYKERLGASG